MKWTGRESARSPRRLVEPMTCPVFRPPPASQAAGDLRPVVAAGVVVDLRRPAELAPGDDDGVVEHAADLQVLDQGREALVELPAVVADEVEVLAVAVPAAVAQGHAADAGLDQPAGHQELIVAGRGAVVLVLVRLAVAVLVAEPRVFLREVQRVDQLARREHVEGQARWPSRRLRAAPLASTSRRSWSKLRSRPRRSASRSAVMPLSVMFFSAGPSGLNGACAGPRKPAAPGSLQGTCRVVSARPTNGGTDGIDRPLHPADDRAEARPAADGLQVVERLAGVALVQVVPPGGADDRADDRRLVHQAASLGNVSPMWMPGTFVSIGLNSPRISSGASGLRSHMSWCGGPPARKMLMTALCRLGGRPAARAGLLGARGRRRASPGSTRTPGRRS